MLLEAIFDDGTFILGERGFKERIDECWGTHHLRVISSSEGLLIGREIAIPVTKPRYWIIHKIGKAYER